MVGRGSIEFEPIVEFPDNAMHAARMYLGAMAYPELGAGQPGGAGVRFSNALGQYVIWQRRKARGLRDVRLLFDDPNYNPPRRRAFEGALERGRRRLIRRFAAYDVVGNQMINGFLNARMQADCLIAQGRTDEALHTGDRYRPIRQEIWDKATPSARRIVRRDLTRWSNRLGLHETGVAADPIQKERDLISRGLVQSRPVLHMAHGLNQILADKTISLTGLERADWLLVLIWNADAWVWKAIDHAVSWRKFTSWDRFTQLSPGLMIELVPAKKMQ